VSAQRCYGPKASPRTGSLPSRDSEIGPEPEEDRPYHDQALWEQARWMTGSITVTEDPRDAWSGTTGRQETSRRSGPATDQDRRALTRMELMTRRFKSYR
jgi:hypothetical protein